MSTSISGKTDPVVQSIATSDVVDAIAAGFRDFQRVPRYGLALGAFCAATGAMIVWAVFAASLPYLAYPLAAGFAFLGPLIAAVLYEVSRRLERDLPITAAEVWQRVKSRTELRWMGFMTLFIFIMWMYQVRFLLAIFLGERGMAPTLPDLVNAVLTTNEGLLFLAIGNVEGAILAAILFSLSVVSFPLVLDRDVDFVTAMITSLRAVARNPKPMALWAAIIAVVLFVSMLPLFGGLVVTLPILGHATWHLYRRTIAPSPA